MARESKQDHNKEKGWIAERGRGCNLEA